MAWSTQLTYVVVGIGPAAIVVLLLVHVAIPVDTRRGWPDPHQCADARPIRLRRVPVVPV